MTESELALSLTRYWYIAATAQTLRHKPIRRTILGQPIVLFRDGNGVASALLDRCAHRNMRLSAGRTTANGIECPYHGWTFDGRGTCTAAPSLVREDLPQAKVPSFPAREQQGFIWIYMGEGEPAVQPFVFPNVDEPRWTTFRMTTRFEASAFACLENFLDVPHTVYVHGGLFRTRATRVATATVRTERDGAVAEFDEEPERRSVVARLLFPRAGKLTHTDRFVMPTTSRVDYSFSSERHFIITSQCTPVSAHETDVYTVVTFRYGSIAPLVRLYFEPLSRRILRQDVEILAEHSANLRRFDAPRYTFAETDLLGPRILRLWRDAVASRATEESTSVVTLRF